MVKCTNCKNYKAKEEVYDKDVDEVFIMYYCEEAGWIFEEEALMDLPCENYEQNMDADPKKKS